MEKILNFLRELTGFSQSGASILGKIMRAYTPKKHGHKVVRLAISVLIVLVISLNTLPAIGGGLAINASYQQPSIDTRTVDSVQSPVNFAAESRGFSWFHTGADLVANTGTPVFPIMEGRVIAVNHDFLGYGNHVIIKHVDSYESLYGHLSKIDVHVGQKVVLSTKIGEVGSTGLSTGPHLHLEIHQNGVLVNPADLVPEVK